MANQALPYEVWARKWWDSTDTFSLRAAFGYGNQALEWAVKWFAAPEGVQWDSKLEWQLRRAKEAPEREATVTEPAKPTDDRTADPETGSSPLYEKLVGEVERLILDSDRQAISCKVTARLIMTRLVHVHGLRASVEPLPPPPPRKTAVIARGPHGATISVSVEDEALSALPELLQKAPRPFDALAALGFQVGKGEE